LKNSWAIKKKLRMTIKELAEKSGVSIGILSEIPCGTIKDTEIRNIKSLSMYLRLVIERFSQ